MSVDAWLLVAFVGLLSVYLFVNERVLALLSAVAGLAWVLVTLVKALR